MTGITNNRQKNESDRVSAISPLGEKLRKIRQKIIDSGIPLLGDEEIDREVEERRGGQQKIE
ncbi:hypothetical protein V0288_08895 [Pannus brasiliensis CCIBt3594]|uniref:Uncharacterized protein n=1 Tax=Pannus brasiliensis CCIBt3594 TaxID=1427578 RepID=A0AAW9QJG0_9CHRO